MDAVKEGLEGGPQEDIGRVQPYLHDRVQIGYEHILPGPGALVDAE